MRKIYFLSMGLLSLFCTAQQTISFESSEGFTLGSIHQQNNWEVTLNADNAPIQGQEISNELASDGNYSLKLSVDADENYGWFPIFGAAKEFDTSIDYKNLNIELDVYITDLNGSTYEFGAFGVFENEFIPIAIYSFNYTGNLEIVSNIDYDYEVANFSWENNRWYKLKAEISEDTIKYYIDGNLVFTGPNYSKVNVEGLNFVHDNFGGSAYIDNIKINNRTLATSSVKSQKLTTYPNPVKDILRIDTPQGEQITAIELYNTAGQKVAYFANEKEISVASLQPGLYIVKAITKNDKVYNTKIIKE